MKNSFCCNSIIDSQFTTNFCTCHDSTAVVSCAKFCNDQSHDIWMRWKLNFHGIRITTGESFVKWVSVSGMTSKLPSFKLEFADPHLINYYVNTVWYLDASQGCFATYEICRDHFVYAPSQWEIMLHCNVVSHWLGTCTKWSLNMLYIWNCRVVWNK